MSEVMTRPPQPAWQEPGNCHRQPPPEEPAPAPRLTWSTPQYGNREYWDARYSREHSHYEWYRGWASLSAVLGRHLPRGQAILQVGVGTSNLQADMAADGYQAIVNVDYSGVVTARMAALHAHLPQLTYQVADCRYMPEFAEGSFAAVLDKGTVDAILCGADSGINTAMTLSECSRVLRPGGCFVMVTYGAPEARLPHLCRTAFAWDIAVYAMHRAETPTNGSSSEGAAAEAHDIIEGPFPAGHSELDHWANLKDRHYIYVCTKRGAPPPPPPPPISAAPPGDGHGRADAAPAAALEDAAEGDAPVASSTQ